MESEQKYGYWALNSGVTFMKDDNQCFVFNCSACGHEAIEQWPEVCPKCHAIMVDPLDITDINDRDICAGDIVLCNINGHKERVRGKIIHDTQWYLDNPVGFRWIYDCNNFEIVEGTIPKGRRLSKNFGNSISNRRR